jgi:hypothetical protein
MILRAGLIAIFFILCLSGCSTTKKSTAWKSDDVAFSDFKAFDIQPVSNATGHFLSPEILSSLSANLKEEFEIKKLPLSDSRYTEIEILAVQSEILKYKFQFFKGPPPPSGDIVGLCIVRTRLLQMPSSHIVAEVITVNQIDVGRGVLEPKNPESLLQDAAATIAREVAKML